MNAMGTELYWIFKLLSAHTLAQLGIYQQV